MVPLMPDKPHQLIIADVYEARVDDQGAGSPFTPLAIYLRASSALPLVFVFNIDVIENAYYVGTPL
jgi:hypothetical protein